MENTKILKLGIISLYGLVKGDKSNICPIYDVCILSQSNKTNDKDSLILKFCTKKEERSF